MLNCSIHHRVSAGKPKQAVAAILRWKATRPPSTQRKQSVTQAYTVHFLPAADGAFRKPFLVQMGFCVLWLRKVPKTAGHPPPKKKNQPKMRQHHPKMGFEGILDCLTAISIPARSTS